MDFTVELPYLGRTITYNNTNWAALYANLRKAQKRWGGGSKGSKTDAGARERTVHAIQGGSSYSITLWV